MNQSGLGLYVRQRLGGCWSRFHTEPVVVVVVVYRYTLQASTFQMAILLQYNTEDSYTVQQLTDSTQIKTVSTTLQLPRTNNEI